MNLVKTKVFFNSVIRFFIQSYLKFCEIGCLFLSTLSFMTTSEIASSVTGLVIFAFVVAFPIAVAVLLRRKRLSLENDDIK